MVIVQIFKNVMFTYNVPMWILLHVPIFSFLSEKLFELLTTKNLSPENYEKKHHLDLEG